MRHLPQRALRTLFVATLLSTSPGGAEANYLDDDAAFNEAFSELRSAIGDHARALQIVVDPEGVEIQAQDSRIRRHIDHWRYGIVTYSI